VTKPYGVLTLRGETWEVDAEPHVVIRLKRCFGKADKYSAGIVKLKNGDEICRELSWFMDRYPLEMKESDRKFLEESANRHVDRLKRLEDMIDPNYKPREFKMALPAREYQRRAAEAFLTRGFLLLGDDVGLGKTASAIAALTDPKVLPAAVVTLAGTLPMQWMDELRRFAPDLMVHVVKKSEAYELPRFFGRGPDVVVLNYHKLFGWAKLLKSYAKSVVYDEIQELRRTDSAKYKSALELSTGVRYRLGLSATPIYNYGGEIFNVVNCLSPGVLGTHEEFNREWCSGFGEQMKLKDPSAFGTYLREQFIMMRRTRRDVGRELPELQKIVQKTEADAAALDKVKSSAAELAKIILGAGETHKGQKMQAAEELSNSLRQATGIAKAPYVADFIQLLVESGERVLVYAWHREVYSVIRAKLFESHVKSAMFTGSETANDKLAAKNAFIKGDIDVLLMSLRSGAGVDGLQKACKTIVFAELDWAPGVHEQCVGRVYRDGQPDPVIAYFLVADEGSDPIVSEVLGLKREQIEGIRSPGAPELEELQTDGGHIRKLAEHYLKKAGIKLPDQVPLQLPDAGAAAAPPAGEQPLSPGDSNQAAMDKINAALRAARDKQEARA
jgi:SNF2 family DNA or RNA helicase